MIRRLGQKQQMQQRQVLVRGGGGGNWNRLETIQLLSFCRTRFPLRPCLDTTPQRQRRSITTTTMRIMSDRCHGTSTKNNTICTPQHRLFQIRSIVTAQPLPQQQQRRTTTKKKIMFQSLGCPRNLVDTEVMLGMSVHDGGWQVTPHVQDADYVVVNTCGFLQAARQESKDAIQELIDQKQPHSKLIVTGCMVNSH